MLHDAIPDLPEGVVRFIEGRVERGGVAAVLIYGSYARGTQHERSDVDVIFVVDDGFASECVVHEGYCIEVLESTKGGLYAHWEKNFDEDRHWYLWKDVKIVFDRDAQGAEILDYAQSLVGERQPWSPDQIDNNRLTMSERFERARFLHEHDPGTAAIVLVELVQTLTENWFRVRGRFVPSPKEFLGVFSAESPEFGELLRELHLNSTDPGGRFDLVERMFTIIYE